MLQYSHIKINEHKILPKNLHPLTITLVLNFHKALKNYARSPQHYFKLPVKLIKRVKLRVHYTLPDLYALYMSPPSPSSLMPKQQSLVLLESASASRYQRELLRKWCKIRCFRTKLFSACCSARASPRSKKRFKVKQRLPPYARADSLKLPQRFALTSPLSAICLLRGY